MSNSNSASPPQFDVATAALEHLELLNRSNVNPLEVAAQFRTLLRSKKTRGNNFNNKNDNSPPSSSNMDYTYMDYLAADATHRRRTRSRGRADRRSKSLGRIKYDLEEDDDTNNQSIFSHYNQDQSSLNYEHDQSHLRSTIDDANIYYTTSTRHPGLLATTNNSTRQYIPESHSCFGLSKWHDEGDSSTEDIYADSAVGSDYSEPPPHLAFPSSKAVSCDSAISGTSSNKQYSSSSSEQNPNSSSSLLISPTKQHFANLSQIDETSEQTASIDRSLSSASTNNHYPTINWKQLREKQHGHSIDKAKTFVSSTLPRKLISLQTTTAPSVKPANLNTSSPISLLNYHKNQPNFQRRIEQFNTNTSNRPSRPRAVTTDLSQALQSSATMTTSSLTTVSAISAQTPSESESFTYPNVSELRKNFERKSQKKIPKPIESMTSTSVTPPLESPLSYAPSLISTDGSRSPSSSSSSSSSSASSVCKSRRLSSSSRSSNEIRTPSISPPTSPRPTYTISRLNAASMNNEDILFPIADCNLVIKHKVNNGPRKTGHCNRRPPSPHPHPPHLDNLSNSMYSISSGYTEEAHLSGVCNENELLGGSTDDAVYV